MAKEDFCFTYYDGDAAHDKAHMTRLQRGAYDDFISAQRKRGHLTVDDVKRVLGKDFDECWPALEWVLKLDSDGKYYLQWLEKSIQQMRAHAKLQSDKALKSVEAKAKRKPAGSRSSAAANNGLNTGIADSEPLEDGNGIGDESEDVSGNELYGKCENFFHGDVPGELIELSASLVSMPNAGEWQRYVHAEIEKLGYTVKREQGCKYISKEGKKINGRIDLVASYGDVLIGIELDDRQPRLKSIRKVETYACGMVLLRDPKPVKLDAGEYQFPRPLPKVTTPAVVANVTDDQFAEYEYWTEQVIKKQDHQFEQLIMAENIRGEIDLAAHAKSFLALLATYPKKAPPSQHRFRVALVAHIMEKIGSQPSSGKSTTINDRKLKARGL